MLIHTKQKIIFLCISALTYASQNIISYQIHTLTPDTYKADYYQDTIDNVNLMVKRLTKNEIKTIFNNQGEALFTYRPYIIPLHISITNMSNDTVIIAPGSISLRLIDYTRVTKRLSYNTTNYISKKYYSGLFISSTLLGVAFSFGTLGSLYALPSLLYAAQTTFFLTAVNCCLVTPLESYFTYKKYKTENLSLAADAHAKILSGTLHIPPKSRCNFLIFAHHKKFKKKFSIICFSQKTKSQNRSFTILL